MATVRERVRELAEAVGVEFSRLSPSDRIALLTATATFELAMAETAKVKAIEVNSAALMGAVSQATGELN